jgi:hypothetical protein
MAFLTDGLKTRSNPRDGSWDEHPIHSSGGRLILPPPSLLMSGLSICTISCALPEGPSAKTQPRRGCDCTDFRGMWRGGKGRGDVGCSNTPYSLSSQQLFLIQSPLINYQLSFSASPTTTYNFSFQRTQRVAAASAHTASWSCTQHVASASILNLACGRRAAQPSRLVSSSGNQARQNTYFSLPPEPPFSSASGL